MSQSKGHSASLAPKKEKLIDTPLKLVGGAFLLGYAFASLIIHTVLGVRAAALAAIILWGVPVFFITKWDRTRTTRDTTWREYIKFPQLKLWKLILIVLIIFVIQNAASYFSTIYMFELRPELMEADFSESYLAQFDVWPSAIIFWAGGISSYFIGGFMAGKLCRYKYQAPYSHAAIGGFIVVILNIIVTQIIIYCECGPPTLDTIGAVALALPVTMALSLFGVWVATKTRLLSSIIKFSESSNQKFSELGKMLKGHTAPTTPAVNILSPQQTGDVSRSTVGKGQKHKATKRKKQKRRR
jgi:hypothetical protein